MLVSCPPHSPCMKLPFFIVWKCCNPRPTLTLLSASCITDAFGVFVLIPLLSDVLLAARGVPTHVCAHDTLNGQSGTWSFGQAGLYQCVL